MLFARRGDTRPDICSFSSQHVFLLLTCSFSSQHVFLLLTARLQSYGRYNLAQAARSECVIGRPLSRGAASRQVR